MIAPEGTTKHANVLLRFSTGAFVPGRPVLPVSGPTPLVLHAVFLNTTGFMWCTRWHEHACTAAIVSIQHRCGSHTTARARDLLHTSWHGNHGVWPQVMLLLVVSKLRNL